MDELIIRAVCDDESRVLVATHDQLGLATEAETVDVLVYRLQEIILELAELNNVDVTHPLRFKLVSEKSAVAFA